MSKTDSSSLTNAVDGQIQYEDSAKRVLLKALGKKLDVQTEEAIWRGVKLTHRIMQEYVFADGRGDMDVMEFAYSFARILKGMTVSLYGGHIHINAELREEEDVTISPTTLIGTAWLLAMAAKPEIELSEEELCGLYILRSVGGPQAAASAEEKLERSLSKVPQLRSCPLRYWFESCDEEFSVDQRGVITTDGGFPEEPRKILFDPAKHPELEADFNALRLLPKGLK